MEIILFLIFSLNLKNKLIKIYLFTNYFLKEAIKIPIKIPFILETTKFPIP